MSEHISIANIVKIINMRVFHLKRMLVLIVEHFYSSNLVCEKESEDVSLKKKKINNNQCLPLDTNYLIDGDGI